MRIFFYLTACFFLGLQGASFGQDSVSINIDFGSSNTLTSGWNNLTLPRTGSILDLKDQFGQSTGISIDVIDAFNGINQSGTDMPHMAIGIPSTASGDSFFGNTVEFSGVIEETAAIEFSGLQSDVAYSLDLFASRIANDNRETRYIIKGSETDTLDLQVANNTMELIQLSNLKANQNGGLIIEMMPGDNNNNSFNFYYLGAAKLLYERTEPFTRSLELLHPKPGAFWQTGKSPEIRWKSRGLDSLNLSYSINEGQTWSSIASVKAFDGKYQWDLPSLNSDKAIIRIEQDTFRVESGFFQIKNETFNDCHIVVLGSSTAAGSGPSVRDSAWVWRYRDALFQKDTRFQVTNLARGGFTTYDILPSDAIIPDSINKVIDSTRNISMALSLDPDAVIINLPSNDAANGFPVVDQLRNYDWMINDLKEDSIPFWICTPQPRNNFSELKKQIQLDMVDSTFVRFQDRAIDFWSDFHTENHDLKGEMDSGDGVHMNDFAHRILLSRVLIGGVDTFLLSEKNGIPTSLTKNSSLFKGLEVSIFPNPTSDQLTIQINVSNPVIGDLNIFNEQGQLIKVLASEVRLSGESSWNWDCNNSPKGTYIFQFVQRNNTGVFLDKIVVR